MPQIQKDKNKPTATTIKEAKPFRDRLRDRYAPSDYVRVINIDNEAFEWQYFPSAGEDVTFTDNGTVRVVSGRQSFTKNYEQSIPGNEQIWSIDAGDEEVLVGENADLFIEGLYKRLVAKKRVDERPNIEEGKVRKFNWNDGLMQEQMIDKIFLGRETPNFNEQPRSSTATKKK